jgi:hypothetical protein
VSGDDEDAIARGLGALRRFAEPRAMDAAER